MILVYWSCHCRSCSWLWGSVGAVCTPSAWWSYTWGPEKHYQLFRSRNWKTCWKQGRVCPIKQCMIFWIWDHFSKAQRVTLYSGLLLYACNKIEAPDFCMYFVFLFLCLYLSVRLYLFLNVYVCAYVAGLHFRHFSNWTRY